MPTTRLKRSREIKTGLTKPERHLLLTGECTPPKGNWRDQGEKVFRTFSLVSPAGREELKGLWEKNKAELLAGWKGKGKPWASVEFDK
jgi:hypothetical protein